MAVEEDEAAGAVRALGKEVDGFPGGEIGAGRSTRNVGGRVHAGLRAAKQICGGFRHDDFHDGFTVAGAGDSAGFGVGVAAAADERGITDPAGKFAAGAPGGSRGEQISFGVDRDGADGSLFVAAVMLGGVFVASAFHPGFVLGFADQFLALAELDAVFLGEALCAFGDEHHVRAIFEDLAGDLDGILDTMQSSGRSGAQRGAVHDDGVAFDVAVQIEVRAVTGVEDGVVFKDDDGGFDSVEGGAAAGKDGPTGSERAMAAGFAGVNGFVGNVPRAAVNNERWFHDQRIAEKKENGKWKFEKRNTKLEKLERKGWLNAETQSAQRRKTSNEEIKGEKE